MGNGRSREAKKSVSPIMHWIYAWQILSHNMSLIYACPQVWAMIINEAGEIQPDGGRCDIRTGNDRGVAEMKRAADLQLWHMWFSLLVDYDAHVHIKSRATTLWNSRIILM